MHIRTAKPARIAFCENGAGYGGAIVSLAAFLEKRSAGYQAFLYTALGSAEYRQLSRLGHWRRIAHWKTVDRRTLEKLSLPFAGQIDNLLNVAPEVLRYYLAFKRDRITLVYLNNDPISNLAPAMAAQLCGLPMVLHMRGFCDRTASTDWVLKRVRHVIAVSGWIRNNLLEFGVAAQDCCVVPEGLNLALFAPQPEDRTLRARLALPDRAPVITLVGGLVRWKGQDVVLAACQAVFARYPQARVLLVGSSYDDDSGYVRAIHAAASSEAMAGRVLLLGPRSDVPALLALSTIVLHASTEPEPFGRTFLEGMAMGRPVIAANAGGPAEVISDGVDGVLIEPGRPELLAQAILALLDDAAARDRMGQAAALTARRFSIESHVAGIEAVLARYGVPVSTGLPA